MEYLIIDGYNIINAWRDIFKPGLDTLEDSREKLLNILSNFQGFRKINVIVVFDAHQVKGSQEKVDFFDNIQVVFTKENETADYYIERLVYNLGRNRENVVRVVTLDYLEQTTVLNSGGVRVTPKELRAEIEKHTRILRSSERNKRYLKLNTLDSNLDTDTIEKLEKLRRGK
ncbi:MAG TPA: NYN domain-containing protein [Clostridiaceae bacterium]|jgi:predicted RNA-binding protein with PIN domain|nr:NYN domain-containing protein [Clostridiaceae bacterium]